jgi:hypothetical protein
MDPVRKTGQCYSREFQQAKVSSQTSPIGQGQSETRVGIKETCWKNDVDNEAADPKLAGKSRFSKALPAPPPMANNGAPTTMAMKSAGLARFNVTATNIPKDATGKARYFEGTPIPTTLGLDALMAYWLWGGNVLDNIPGGVWAVGRPEAPQLPPIRLALPIFPRPPPKMEKRRADGACEVIDPVETRVLYGCQRIYCTGGWTMCFIAIPRSLRR